MRLLVTRPLAQARAWVADLRRLGCDAVALPLIEIGPADDPAPVRAAWQNLGERAVAMFVSANAVEHFFALAPPGARWPAGVQAASTGPGTSAALRRAGVDGSRIVEPPAAAGRFDSEALWERLSTQDWRDRRVLVVRGEEGRDWLAEAWRSQGAVVEFVAAYQRRPPRFDAAASALLEQAAVAPHAHLWHFSSSEAVAHLRAARPRHDWSRSAALASHPRIAQAAREAGFGRVALVGAAPAAVAEAVRAWPSIQSPPQ